MTINYSVKSSGSLQGEIKIPGDKSISHRAIILGAIAEGNTEITNFLTSADCYATVNAFQAMGVNILQSSNHSLTIQGVGREGLSASTQAIDLGNSGTSMRLLAGLLAGQSFKSILTGDNSLQQRPMARVVMPLRQMGAKIEMTHHEFAPLTIYPADSLHGMKYAMPIASAQVKSSLLLASLYAHGTMEIQEPQLSRDHTERMLATFGCKIQKTAHCIRMACNQKLKATSIEVPGDLSSAAFFMVAATICPNSEILLKDVGINPTRMGFITLFQQMGANIKISNERMSADEPIADIHVKTAKLHGIDIPAEMVPLAIDEFPVLLVGAACAQGTTTLEGAQELRMKESDRISMMANGLSQLGIRLDEYPDGITIEGGILRGGIIESAGDHRIAMAFAVAGAVAKDEILIKDCANVATSFPNFVELAHQLGLGIKVMETN